MEIDAEVEMKTDVGSVVRLENEVEVDMEMEKKVEVEVEVEVGPDVEVRKWLQNASAARFAQPGNNQSIDARAGENCINQFHAPKRGKPGMLRTTTVCGAGGPRAPIRNASNGPPRSVFAQKSFPTRPRPASGQPFWSKRTPR